MKTVSVLVPVYKVENFIQRCAESIFEQTYEQLDIVFVDDCSPDNSIQVMLEALEHYPKRKKQVRVVKHEKNRGLAAARNTGVYEAVGDYVLHVDSDDYIDNTTISKCVEKMESTDADVVTFDVNHLYSNKVYVDKLVFPASKDDYLSLLLSRKVRVCIWCSMYKISLYKEHEIQAIEGVNIGEDYTVSPRLIYYAQKVVHIPVPLYNYIHYNDNSYTFKFSYNNVLSHIKIFSLLRNFFENKDGGKFLDAIDYGETLFKATLEIEWALTDNSIESLNIVKDSFTTYQSNIPLSKKLVLLLSKFPFLLKIYCRFGFNTKQFFK